MRARYLAVLLAMVSIAGCGDDKEPGDHVWKEQTATIDKAKEVEGLLQQSAKDQAREIEARTQ